MAEILERTLNPRVAPRRILRRHANHQTLNLCPDTGSSRSASGVRPLARHQLAMPSENGVRRDDRGNPRERATAEAPADHGETAPFIIAQAQPSTVQLHLEHAILFAQKLNHVALLSIKPPEQRRKEHVSGTTRGVYVKAGRRSFRTLRAAEQCATRSPQRAHHEDLVAM
jgi:hypothetical protein